MKLLQIIFIITVLTFNGVMINTLYSSENGAILLNILAEENIDEEAQEVDNESDIGFSHDVKGISSLIIQSPSSLLGNNMLYFSNPFLEIQSPPPKNF